jgi:hypothetical protein
VIGPRDTKTKGKLFHETNNEPVRNQEALRRPHWLNTRNGKVDEL